MSVYRVKITDSKGRSCLLKLEIPFVTSATDGQPWSAITLGCLRYNNGYCQASDEDLTGPTSIWLARGDSYGIVIEDMFDSWGRKNTRGSGILYHSWCVSLTSGAITWVLDR